MVKSEHVTCPYCGQRYLIAKIWLEERVEEHKKIFCPNKEGHIKILADERFNSVPKEKRQEILDLLKTGLTVGQVCEKVNLELMVVSEVICRNIESACYLRNETV